MKILVCAALVAAQTVAAVQPAFAADIQHESTAATGTFGGVRLRIPFGGSAAERAPRFGLALAPTVHNMNDRGEMRMRIGEGFEFGFSQGRPDPSLSIAGRRLSAAQDNQNGDEDDDDGGIDTGEAILIAGGVIVLVAGAGLLWLVNEINESSE